MNSTHFRNRQSWVRTPGRGRLHFPETAAPLPRGPQALLTVRRWPVCGEVTGLTYQLLEGGRCDFCAPPWLCLLGQSSGNLAWLLLSTGPARCQPTARHQPSGHPSSTSRPVSGPPDLMKPQPAGNGGADMSPVHSLPSFGIICYAAAEN